MVAESLMTSTVHIRRAGPVARNPETGTETPSWTDVYVGPGRLRASDAQPRDVDSAGQKLTDRSLTLSLPIGDHPDITHGRSADVDVDDVGELLENPDDPESSGTKFRVRDGHVQTHSTARRLPVEVTSHAR